MSLQINTLNVTSAWRGPKTVHRVFNVTPTLYGQSIWNLDTMGPINISGSGQWTFTPTSNFSSNVKMWGAAGGRAYTDYKGGGGGYTAGTASFQSNVSYTIVVGAGGKTSAAGVMAGYTIGGGGYGRSSSRPNPQGGGMSGIFRTPYSHSNSVLIAGGGGGGGFGQTGAGGGDAGQAAEVYGNEVATGGTQTAGGSPIMTGTSGSALIGGLGATGTNRSGGGGGGYYGGGAGANGAGGSGYINTSDVTNGVTATGNKVTPANATDADRGSSGENVGTNLFGNDGRVIIS